MRISVLPRLAVRSVVCTMCIWLLGCAQLNQYRVTFEADETHPATKARFAHPSGDFELKVSARGRVTENLWYIHLTLHAQNKSDEDLFFEWTGNANCGADGLSSLLNIWIDKKLFFEDGRYFGAQSESMDARVRIPKGKRVRITMNLIIDGVEEEFDQCLPLSVALGILTYELGNTVTVIPDLYLYPK